MARLYSSRIRARIINRLRAAEGAFVSVPDLIEAAYGDCPKGGPLWAQSCIRSTIMHLRRRGWPLVGLYWKGYRYAASATLDEVLTP